MMKRPLFMIRQLRIVLLILLFTFVMTEQLFAQDLGVQGSVYEIKELDALQWIDKKLRQMEISGEIDRQQQKLKEKVLSSLEHPIPVKGLKPTEKPRTFEKDLTITLTSDMKDAQGRLIHAAGTRINPLSKTFCKKTLIFIDGDNLTQLQWALNEYQQGKDLVKLVLVNGPVLALMRDLRIPLYFDQAGRLIQYFNIEQIPAIVSQLGDKLKIMEIKL